MIPRKLLSIFILLAVLFSLLAGCGGSEAITLPPTPEVASFPGENWPAATPEEQGMDSQKLVDMLEHVRERNIRMHSILIARNGRLVLEAYFNPYGPETHHQIASITKSVMGALVGIAIEQGKIKSLRQPVVEFFKDRQIDNLDERKQAMTLEHLLMLAPGFDCEDSQGTEAAMAQSQDWAQFVLDLPMVVKPGTKWAYCSSAVHLVSAILQSATGMDARTFANQYLFEPIGISEVPPERWPTDPNGISTGGNGLLLTPVEVARFATLYLNQGRWGERQVVPQEWVTASTTPHIEVGKMEAYGNMNRSYGFLWSLYPEQGFYSALGRNGQHIHVFPKENMVVVFTSATSLFSDENQFALLEDYILPAVQSEATLPKNPESAAELEALLEEIAEPRRPVAELPAAGRSLNGETIRFGENAFGWETLKLNFEEGSNTAEIHLNDGIRFSVGLDNLYRVQEIPGIGTAGFRGTWERPDRFTVQQIILGTWIELETNLTIQGNQVTLFQHNVVDGGNLQRIVGEVEE